MTATTQNWLYGIIGYFVIISVLLALFTNAGAFQKQDLITDTSYYQKLRQDIGNLSQDKPAPTINPIGWLDYVEVFFSFFVWDVQFYDTDHAILLQYFWVLRIFIVWLPLLVLIGCIWYSIPTVSG